MKSNFSLFKVLERIYYEAEEGFEVGDYAVIVSGTFCGCEGPVWHVDNENKYIELRGGVNCGFRFAFNITRFSEFAKCSRKYGEKNGINRR